MKQLLERGCDPDIRSASETTGWKGETALLDASFWGRLEIAEMLIQHGAKVDAKAEKGITPLHDAARMGNVEMARLLLKHGAELTPRTTKAKPRLNGLMTAPRPQNWASCSRSGGQRK